MVPLLRQQTKIESMEKSRHFHVNVIIDELHPLHLRGALPFGNSHCKGKVNSSLPGLIR